MRVANRITEMHLIRTNQIQEKQMINQSGGRIQISGVGDKFYFKDFR